MSPAYRVIKAYHLITEDQVQVQTFAAVLIFQDLWLGLTKAQQTALLTEDRWPVPKITMAKLREHQLVDDRGRTTLLGEAVLHYRPGSP